MKSLDEMIMDIEVTDEPSDLVKVKFVAIAGGEGPAFTMSKSLAKNLYEKLRIHLQK